MFRYATQLFTQAYKIPLVDPAVAARVAMITELTCSTLLMLGIVTRGATLPLLPMLLVLLLVYPVDWPNNLLWGSILLFLLTRGTGRFSVDRTIERHFVARGRYQWTDVHIVLGAQARRCHVIEGV